MAKRRELYPEIEPFNTGFLKVSDIHELYFEQSGNKSGKPVVFLHGGPGSGTSERDRRYFNPEHYHIILFDQRGAGKSKPPAELKDNTTWHCVEDMEQLRIHLGIDKWVVFGGSWGSCLALTYAETHPDKVTALVLRGIFTCRRRETLWHNQQGASHIFPDHWESYIEPIPQVERHDLVSAYYLRLTGDNEEEKLLCARRFSNWGTATSRLFVDEAVLASGESDIRSLQCARIECHYLVHGGFFSDDNYLLQNAHKIKHIPTTIVQGRYDVVCPVETAWELHKRLPDADFHLVPDSGHSAKEEGTTHLLIEACDKYAQL